MRQQPPSRPGRDEGIQVCQARKEKGFKEHNELIWNLPLVLPRELFGGAAGQSSLFQTGKQRCRNCLQKLEPQHVLALLCTFQPRNTKNIHEKNGRDEL